MQSELSYNVSLNGLFYMRVGGFTSTRVSPMFEQDLCRRYPASEGFKVSRDVWEASGRSTPLNNGDAPRA
jgi:hypothetical protein